MGFQNSIQVFEVASVECDHGFGFEDALILVQLFTRWQRPQEATQPFYVAALLQHLTHTSHLLLGEAEARQDRTDAGGGGGGVGTRRGVGRAKEVVGGGMGMLHHAGQHVSAG